ncbi:polyphosphate kinase 1 [Floricoccus penangensis]|uniref:polyphosphate kinase 1 n=1 Tax=Floricoccus penangensis TaxID=1859475 RepID=UPI0020405808|nr:polyphosphate kinase 1 [Floricoccus penangensis]URZ88116.1 polyphosphate kinase 1 [Floricoccus penangensis]
MDRSSFSKYYNRDMSWLLFNKRVISQSYDATIPLLERLKFLAIASKNLDEYYSVRIPGIQEIINLVPQARDNKTGFFQKDILDNVCERNRKNIDIQYINYQQLIDILDDNEIFSIKKIADLPTDLKGKADNYFNENIFPCLTCTQFSHYHTKPKYVDGDLNIYVRSFNEDKEITTIIPISSKVDRLIPISDDNFILLEDLILNNLSKILPNNKIIAKFVFRTTNTKGTEIDNDIGIALLNRIKLNMDKEGSDSKPVRLEFAGDDINYHSTDIKILLDMLDINLQSSYLINGPLDLTFLFKIIDKYSKIFPELAYQSFEPNIPNENQDIFRDIDFETILLQHPYESFEYIIKMLNQATEEPGTVEIKQILFDVPTNSKVVKKLMAAAKKGIKVTVVVEFDHDSDGDDNIDLIKQLSESGCTVYCNKDCLKTHSELLLIEKESYDGLRTYVHIGTGSYCDSSSEVASDLSILTSDESYVTDVENFFNYIVDGLNVPNFELISTSPDTLKNMLLDKINEMKMHYLKTGKGMIFLKINALTDQSIIDSLYSAGRTGLPIRMIIRGECCMKLGMCGKKENIVISSIIGRFLENSGIYGFLSDNEDDLEHSDFWISTADLTANNLIDRIDIATPIKDEKLKEKLSNIIKILSDDQKNSYFLDKAGKYKKAYNVTSITNAEHASAQEEFIKSIELNKQKDDDRYFKPKKKKSLSFLGIRLLQMLHL